jgi:hypothetical protein
MEIQNGANSLNPLSNLLTERYGHNTYIYYLEYSEWHIVEVFRPRSDGEREDDKMILCTVILLCYI